MAIISQSVIEEVRARCDIVDVVGAQVPLRRAGASYKALCPFHREKTPSFHVNPSRQSFHCFGCGKGGDVFRFVMEQEGVDFPTAVRLLAHRVGVVVQEEEGEDGARRGVKEVLYRLHEELTKFYVRVLDHASGEDARAYLRDRDLLGDASAPFRIGFAPRARGALLTWASQHGFSAEQLVAGGLLVEREEHPGDYYDRFAGRLMIPIADELGRVIGFSGRVLRAEDHPAKYVNSPETPVFRKSRVLFALDRARQAIADGRRAVLCEGQLDTIRCHVAGLANVVAAQGTAVTEEHARILRRYADEIVLVLDPDAAGRAAAVRSAQVLIEAGLSVRVAALPEGEDPDALIRRAGPEPVRAAIEAALPAVRFQTRLLAAEEDLGSEAGRARAARALLETVRRAPGDVQRQQLLREAADGLHVTPDVLARELSRMRRPVPRRAAPESGGVEGAAGAEEGGAPPAEPPPAETCFLELALGYPAAAASLVAYVVPELFADPLCARFWDVLRPHLGDPDWRPSQAAPEDAAFTRLAARLECSARGVEAGDFTPDQALQDVLLTLWRRRLDRERQALRLRADGLGAAEAAALRMETQELTLKIRTLADGWEAAQPLLEVETE